MNRQGGTQRTRLRTVSNPGGKRVADQYRFAQESAFSTDVEEADFFMFVHFTE